MCSWANEKKGFIVMVQGSRVNDQEESLSVAMQRSLSSRLKYLGLWTSLSTLFTATTIFFLRELISNPSDALDQIRFLSLTKERCWVKVMIPSLKSRNLYTSVHLRDLSFFLHTHTSDNDKKIFINEKSETINDSVLHLRHEREENPASAESQLDEATLYIAAAGGAKRRNLYGVGSKRVDYIKDIDIDYGNKATAVTKVDDEWEKKSMKMERQINKLNKTLEIVCNRFNITLPDCDSDSENSDGGDAHQGPNTSHSRAAEQVEERKMTMIAA